LHFAVFFRFSTLFCLRPKDLPALSLSTYHSLLYAPWPDSRLRTPCLFSLFPFKKLPPCPPTFLPPYAFVRFLSLFFPTLVVFHFDSSLDVSVFADQLFFRCSEPRISLYRRLGKGITIFSFPVCLPMVSFSTPLNGQSPRSAGLSYLRTLTNTNTTRTVMEFVPVSLFSSVPPVAGLPLSSSSGWFYLFRDALFFFFCVLSSSSSPRFLPRRCLLSVCPIPI